MRTRKVSKSKYRNFLQKADEYLQSAKNALEREHWNSAVGNSVHCCINSADALLVFYLGIRSTGERHSDVLPLLRQLPFESGVISSKMKQFSNVLSQKTKAEYTETLLSRKIADVALKETERFYSWVKELLEV
ncbi:MAG: HEPN domain-containing protein [Thermoplasmata archaeon]|nr:HEPN domain-containing protein [Thermoplasmata archaeon]